MNKWMTLLVLVFLTNFVIMPAAGQRQPLGVKEALRLAEESNPQLGRTMNSVSMTRADLWEAVGLEGLDVTHIREGIPNSGSGFGEQNWHISTGFPFPLRALAGWRAVKQRVSAKEYAVQSQLRTVRSAVKTAYAELLYAQEMRHLRKQEVDLAETLTEVVRGRVEVGESAQLDLMKVQLQVAAAQNALLEADLAFENSRYELFRTVGIDPDEQGYDIVFPDTMIYEPFAISQEEVMLALARHPDILGSQGETKAAGSDIQAARYRFLPDLRVGYWPQDFGDGYKAHGLEVGFRFALPFVGSSRTIREKARIQLRDTELQSLQKALDLKKEAESAWHGFESAQSMVVQYVQENSERAEELLQLTREGYQLGQLDLLTVLDTQRTYLSVQSGYYRSLKDYYLRVIEIERLIGRELVFSGE
jgi:cobalt-zinc-cadmium efflux system outer membrane protein